MTAFKNPAGRADVSARRVNSLHSDCDRPRQGGQLTRRRFAGATQGEAIMADKTRLWHVAEGIAFHGDPSIRGRARNAELRHRQTRGGVDPNLAAATLCALRHYYCARTSASCPSSPGGGTARPGGLSGQDAGDCQRKRRESRAGRRRHRHFNTPSSIASAMSLAKPACRTRRITENQTIYASAQLKSARPMRLAAEVAGASSAACPIIWPSAAPLARRLA